MFKDNKELITYINMHETESQNLEYKEGKSWELLKYKLLAALALSKMKRHIIDGLSNK